MKALATSICGLVAAFLTIPALAQDDPIEKSGKHSEWTVQIEPDVWWTSPSGKLSLPGIGRDKVKVEELNIDSPRMSPLGEVTIRGGKWRFMVNGGAYQIDRNDTVADSSFMLGNVAAAPGDVLDVSFDYTLLEGDVGYRIWDRDFAAKSEHPENAVEFNAGLDLIGGLRGQQFDISVAEAGGGSSSSDLWFVEPVIGARGEVEIAHDFTVDLQITGGGWGGDDHSSASLDIALGFQYRFTPAVAAEIGWRQVAYWLSDGSDTSEFEYDGRMAGLFAGVTIRF